MWSSSAASVFPSHTRRRSAVGGGTLLQSGREDFCHAGFGLGAPANLLQVHTGEIRRTGRAGRNHPRAVRWPLQMGMIPSRSEEHTSELQSLAYLVCRLLLEKKKKTKTSRSVTRMI